jgi:hypothetical protein
MTGDRRDVDHVAAVAPRHAGHDQPRQIQDCTQIDVDQRVDIARCGIQDITAPRLAGTINENVELCRGRKRRQGREILHIDRAYSTPGLGRKPCQPLMVSRQRVNLEPLSAEAPHRRSPDT